MKIENEIPVEEYAKALKKAAREKWERVFAKQFDALEWFYMREFRFHPSRNWRFDFIIVRKGMPLPLSSEDISDEYKKNHVVLVDIQGGIWSGGAHVRGLGYKNDIEKMNVATAMGYQVYWFTSEMVEDGSAIKFLEEEVWKG